ncbi:MAG: F0F1 ATP synthase subunit C [Desulfobacteraceae bacterium 4572_123]|nr:MAG: F0F1 ATP synthase subunit C [Desulfobacteraceae bacterium 4572_123]
MTIDIETWVKVAAFTGSGLAMGLGAIGAAIGEGYTAAYANSAISRSPNLSGEIFKSMLVGQAIAESASIFALVIAMLLLFSDFSSQSCLMIMVPISAGLAMGFGAIGSGVGSGFPAGAACMGIARQPAMSAKLTTNMLIGSAVCQTPAIFALVTSFILLFTNFSSSPVSPTWAAILGAGLASGLGAIGSGLGGGFVAGASCEGIARQPNSATTVTNVMLLGQAVTQTTAIYGLLISFILMFKTFAPTDSIAAAVALLGAGLSIGIGAIGPGIGEGLAAQSAVGAIAKNQKATPDITRVMLVGQAVSESTGIYSLVISLVLIFVI